MTINAAQSSSIPFELLSLAEAKNYQLWLRDTVLPYLGDSILELGSGIGNLSQHLPIRKRLVLSEIDHELYKHLKEKFKNTHNDKVAVKHIKSLNDPSLRIFDFDTIVSFNVLEHVEDDATLLREAIELLRSSSSVGPKRIVSIVPAHQWAHGPIDRQFGHFRRYSNKTFRKALIGAGVRDFSTRHYYSRYLNLPALIAWWMKGKIFGSDKIGTGGIKAFEALCPVIRPLDDFLHKAIRLPLGNSLLAVYTVPDA